MDTMYILLIGAVVAGLVVYGLVKKVMKLVMYAIILGVAGAVIYFVFLR